jgi:hypothetical protein
MNKSEREKPITASLNVSPRAMSRRSVLTGAIAAGAVALGAPSTVHARNPKRDPALFNPLKNKGLKAKGDGVTNDLAALQQTIDRALEVLVAEHTDGTVVWDHREATIDLQGRTYRIGASSSSPSAELSISLVQPTHSSSIKTRLRIINGTLLFNLAYLTDPIALRIHADDPALEYPEVTFEHVRVQNLQLGHTGISTGVQIERGLRCSFLNCAIEQRNKDLGSKGFDRNLVLQGCQICSFIDCHFNAGGNHVVFEELASSGLNNTDCRFYGCSFSESTEDAIVSLGGSSGVTAAQCLFDGCSIETAYDVALEGTGSSPTKSIVSLYDTKNMKFRACRFENAAGWTSSSSYTPPPLVLLGSIGGESSDARFIDCNFSGDDYGDGYCITGDATVTGTAIIANVFPSLGSAPVDLSAGFTAAANTRLADQNDVSTETVSDTTHDLDWTKKVHDIILTGTECEFAFVNAADGASITVVVTGTFVPTWPASTLWEGGDAPEPVSGTPTLYTFTQTGSYVYGFGRVDFY